MKLTVSRPDRLQHSEAKAASESRLGPRMNYTAVASVHQSLYPVGYRVSLKEIRDLKNSGFKSSLSSRNRPGNQMMRYAKRSIKQSHGPFSNRIQKVLAQMVLAQMVLAPAWCFWRGVGMIICPRRRARDRFRNIRTDYSRRIKAYKSYIAKVTFLRGAFLTAVAEYPTVQDERATHRLLVRSVKKVHNEDDRSHRDLSRLLARWQTSGRRLHQWISASLERGNKA